MRPRRDGSAPDEVSKRNLTELHVRNVKPVPDRVVRIYDTKQRGLVLQVQPTGHAAWKAYYSHHGRPRWFHIGRTDAIALADARRLAANIMTTWKSELGTLNIVFDEDNDTLSVLRIRLASGCAVAAEAA